MNYSLIVQSTYNEIQIALFQDDTLLETVNESKKTASKNILLTLDALLKNHNLTINSIEYIGVNQGPAPFTTLRVLITTINGIAFAEKIPLIGLNGLEAMLAEHSNPHFPITLCLYNAFSSDAYYGIKSSEDTMETGWNNIDELLQRIKKEFGQPIRAIGSGCTFFQDNITKTLDNITIASPLPQFPSMEFLHTLAQELFTQGQTEEQITPLYLKKAI
ncbi:tRNA (adenosine(37)-N6)-threonylcarbamoyltransferase complex dimerization subunit type 1 TsaB [bacterium]|jgi:tRNA threonylcarbamoyladenosine biosynthesis protein TsaB|nr:tRNA (adenosine(37)-N6)-threonylcarbamoyltransferase complex dimerization subunit type 1 TsaB [bacterium]MBT5015402.1 tRNA (adenosine(37)-N6)-threonylcarbamoyltransferase complex dimerization subunit type 1 TsaB [bacterium]